LQSAGTTAVTIDTSQNVGIGTTSPSAKLHVESSSVGDLTEILKSTDAVNGRSVIYMASAKNSAGTQSNVSMEAQSVSSANADLVFRTSGSNVSAGTERMRIDSSGNVMVATTSSAGKLNVAGQVTATGGIFKANGAPSLSAATAGEAILAPDSGSGAILYGRGTNYDVAICQRSTAVALGVLAGTNDVYVAGNLLGGTTTSNNGGGICVTKSVNGSTIANFENSFGNGGQVFRTIMSAAANNTSSYHIVCGSGNDRLYVYGNGNVVNSNNSYGTLSDVKLKENIVDASSKLAEVMQLKVRNFNLKTEPDHKQIGFIAQELEQVFPALIDNTTSPNDPDDVIKSIKTSVLIPILVKAIQEQQALITAQAETINALTARIVALEAK